MYKRMTICAMSQVTLNRLPGCTTQREVLGDCFARSTIQSKRAELSLCAKGSLGRNRRMGGTGGTASNADSSSEGAAGGGAERGASEAVVGARASPTT